MVWTSSLRIFRPLAGNKPLQPLNWRENSLHHVRILLDESLPRRLARLLTGHEVRTVAQMGWSGLTNGKLLAEAATHFDVVLTADQNIEFQQNMTELPLAVIVLAASSNRIGDGPGRFRQLDYASM